MTDYTKYIGKKVFIETKKNSKYEAEVISVDDSNTEEGIVKIEIIEKFGRLVILDTFEIAKMEEMR